MVQGKCELIALCLSIIGLIGAVAVKVTAFIWENIIVMETHWEGLWMTCFRQANIHMQCKVYDSLLRPGAVWSRAACYSLVGLRCTLCLTDQPRAKSLTAMATGVMQILASVCVIIPVSWTAHTIIRDFYNPLLIDAQRRELGEALLQQRRCRGRLLPDLKLIFTTDPCLRIRESPVPSIEPVRTDWESLSARSDPDRHRYVLNAPREGCSFTVTYSGK
ncbi:claudin-8-like [Sinocyclocheilus anshuiensis]|uniref:claudin-8-like n=1 Tax=Sinocyclocheilus anshuiensis TaxID=1608454 RepID=UPI0007B9AE36|nr:PREDICTED: claudin-8-like [Sinocyclocheilus anshuiensis]